MTRPPDTDQVKLLADAAVFAANPVFNSAIRAYFIEMARILEAPRLLNVVITSDARWRIMGYLLYLADDTERFRAARRCLLRTAAYPVHASARGQPPVSSRTMLGLLKLSNMVRIAPDKRDARVGYYQPTERLYRGVRDW